MDVTVRGGAGGKSKIYVAKSFRLSVIDWLHVARCVEERGQWRPRRERERTPLRFPCPHTPRGPRCAHHPVSPATMMCISRTTAGAAAARGE